MEREMRNVRRYVSDGIVAAANNVSYNQWYFVILLGCFPLSGKITETMRAIFPCYRDQKK